MSDRERRSPLEQRHSDEVAAMLLIALALFVAVAVGVWLGVS